MGKEKLAVIIPTKDRTEELHRLLESIAKQGTMPSQIIVVDGSAAASAKKVLSEYPNLGIEYIHKIPASLTTQRNEGIRVLRGDITLVAFLDDDIVLERESFASMITFWEGASQEVGGAAFNLTNVKYKKADIFQVLFMANSSIPCSVLKSGFQSKWACLNKTTVVQWLVGCSMVWRKSIFNESMFDEWFSGYSRYEDLDFSYRVGKKYKLFVVVDARAKHLNKLENIDFSYSLGKMEVINRLYFVRKNKELSLFLCYWALFGLFLNNVIKGLLRIDKRYMLRAQGNFAGLLGSTQKI